MLITTEGKCYVFGLFSADGHECESLEGVFANESSAQSELRRLQTGAEIRGEELGRPHKISRECYGDPDLLEVRMLEVKE